MITEHVEVWINKDHELPISGTTVFAKKTETSKIETVPSDWVRDHITQYQYWQYPIANYEIAG